MKGSRAKGLDRVYLKFFEMLSKNQIFVSRMAKYQWINELSIPKFCKGSKKRLLMIDDPVYTLQFEKLLLEWENFHSSWGASTFIVCTSEFTKTWLLKFLKNTQVCIIEQGYTSLNSVSSGTKNREFSCVYSSPFIHLNPDKLGDHSTWGSKILIEEIIPGTLELDENIKFHLIGRVGKHAGAKLRQYPNVVLYGLLTPLENARVMQQCHIGIYPRRYDHFRRVLKVYEYLGAELPIVTFSLEDTAPVQEEELGMSVNTVEDFISSIVELKRNLTLYKKLVLNVTRAKEGRSWSEQAKKLDLIYSKSGC
jgi:hypothetical protein